MLLLHTVSRATVLSSGTLSGHSQCEFRQVYNNNQQNQYYLVWSATRKIIFSGGHSICTTETRGTKEVYFQLVFVNYSTLH